MRDFDPRVDCCSFKCRSRESIAKAGQRGIVLHGAATHLAALLVFGRIAPLDFIALLAHPTRKPHTQNTLVRFQREAPRPARRSYASVGTAARRETRVVEFNGFHTRMPEKNLAGRFTGRPACQEKSRSSTERQSLLDAQRSKPHTHSKGLRGRGFDSRRMHALRIRSSMVERSVRDSWLAHSDVENFRPHPLDQTQHANSRKPRVQLPSMRRMP